MPWIEGVEALQGIEEMPHGSGIFFLEELGIRGAAAFSDFLSKLRTELHDAINKTNASRSNEGE